MKTEEDNQRRVRFYGVNDLAAYVHAPRATEIALEFDPEHPPTKMADVLELFNVQQYLEHAILPSSSTSEERDRLGATSPKIRSAIARFFSAIDNSSLATVLTGVGFEYHADLIELLGRSKVFERCDSDIVLSALTAAGLRLGEMLANRNLVNAYSSELRAALLASPRGAEYLVRKFLEKDAQQTVHLPPSFTPADSREILERYVDSEDANLNYVRLIANTNDHSGAGIDAKLRLRAKRRSDELTVELFTQGQTFKTGVELGISDGQDEPVALEVDSSEGWTQRYKYSRPWLDETLDYPSVLNNFQHLFEFADRHVILSFPAYPAMLGVMERVMGLTGAAEYKMGSAFRAVDSRSLLQTQMYRRFLESQGIDLEAVISWFCETYLVDEFEAQNFSFNPSDRGASNLQKVRQLFAEMESIANQFTLFANNGELDRELLTIGSDQVRYKAIPSLLKGKYVYPTKGREISDILHLLFSDQSSLQYIDENLNAHSAASLLVNNQVSYANFNDYQKTHVDMLIGFGVLEDTGARVQFANGEQLLVLAALFNTQTVSYYHLSGEGRTEVNIMVEKGWVARRSSLLTEAEGDYFNYFLNKVGFINGPNLRNTYQHGSQAGKDDSDHFTAYITALRLTIALVIKINDDFCLSAAETAGVASLSGGLAADKREGRT